MPLPTTRPPTRSLIVEDRLQRSPERQHYVPIRASPRPASRADVSRRLAAYQLRIAMYRAVKVTPLRVPSALIREPTWMSPRTADA